MNNLEEIIGYKFNNASLLKQALVHSSATPKLNENYERLEFLGDRVLGVCVANMLYKHYDKEPEGSLSIRHTVLVCKETVAEIALKLGLEKFVKTANSEIKNNENVLCDVCEAIIGAIFLDGGFEKVVKFVEKNWQDEIVKNICPPKDAKTSLQEVAHVKGMSAPLYKVVKREGSEHEPVFSVAVVIEGMEDCVGKGKNKKIAEQEAAAKMLHLLGVC